MFSSKIAFLFSNKPILYDSASYSAYLEAAIFSSTLLQSSKILATISALSKVAFELI